MKRSCSIPIVLLTISLLLDGCSNSTSNPTAGCAAGEQLACSCAEGGSGIRTCDSTGAYGVCDCSKTQIPTSDGGTNANTATDGGSDTDTLDVGTDTPDKTPDASVTTQSLLPLYSTCSEDAECDSSFCFLYNDGAHLCTKTCVTSADCPSPSTGCNNKGICKDPK